MLNCQMSSWLAGCKVHAYRTELIELPESFLSYLTADRVYVSESSKAVSFLQAKDDKCRLCLCMQTGALIQDHHFTLTMTYSLTV